MKKEFFILVVLTLVISTTASAQFGDLWKNVTNTVGQIVQTSVNIATAPTQTVINAGQAILGNQNADQIFQPLRNIGQSAGNSVIGAANMVSEPQSFLYQKAREYSRQIGGPTGEFVFDVGNFSTQLYTQMGIAATQATGQVLKGQNPLIITAAPLAAAIRAARDARDAHYGNSYQLPNDVREGLKGKFSDAVLNRVRYAAGTIEITLPNFIGQGIKFQEDHYAVTVDDIIVFKNSAPPFEDNEFWWAHEITHVEQYMRWGIEVFAFNFIKDLGKSVEAEADNKGNQVAGSINVFSQSAARSYDMGATAETFVAQCFFPADPYPVNYLISNYGRIIAVNPIDGSSMHVGYSAPPVFPGSSWSYQTPMFRYSVTPQGGIFLDRPIYNQFGQFVGNNPIQVGYVIAY
jgi:hypothetical protein